uniref:restriction endonuclease subunit S n=1 Tax=Aliarcobacter sp. TaxID=2321116 RepID=UPI0040482C62
MIQVPYGWEVKPLKDILSIQYGKDQKEVELVNGKYPILGSGGVIGYTNHFLYDKPSVLIGRKGTINNPQYMETPFWTVDTLFYSHIKNKNIPKWVYYVFQSINWNSYNEASGVPSLSTTNINRIEILKPTIKEQEKIAKILSTLDNAIESTNRIIEKEKNIKTALMQELLTNGIDKNGQIRTPQTHTYKPSELGLIPDEWEILSLEKLISKVIDFRGKTPVKIGMKWGNGLIPSLSANNVQMGRVDFSKETHFGSEELYNLWMNKGSTQKDDILFTMEAPLGNVALIPDNNKYILSQRVILLRIGKKIISHYMYYYMMGDDFQTRMLKYSSGSTVKGIQYSRLKEIYISFPKDIDEQKQIAKILTTQDKKIEREETKLAKLKELKKGLMNDLLSGVVRVKV